MLATTRVWLGMRTPVTCRRLSDSCKVSYYYSQAAVTITYWKCIQAHAILPAVDDGARDALVGMAGLASASTSALPFADALLAFNAADDNVSDDDFPPRTCFLPAGQAADEGLAATLAGRGALLGVHVPLLCTGPRDEWERAIEATRAAKAAGLKVKVVLHDALAADIWDLALTVTKLCDAGADILTLEALGGDVDEDAFRDAVDAINENDVLGVPMMMRLGARFGPSPTGDRDEAQVELVKGLVAMAACAASRRTAESGSQLRVRRSSAVAAAP